MHKLNSSEIKKIELKLLVEVDDICKKIGVKYSLAGGTLLGAVRHKGFIPWDDDIDIIMMRRDYNRFIEYCNSKTIDIPFYVISHNNNSNYGKLYAKAVDKKTIIKDSVVIDNDAMGLFVDIFPIDYLEDSYEESVKKYNSTLVLRKLLLVKQWKKYYRNKEIPLYYEPFRFIAFLLSRLLNAKLLINKIESKYSNEKRKYSGAVSGAYGVKEILKTELFEELTTITFEGESFMAIKEYDKYLGSLYGDYMQLPPVGKRVSNHSFEAYIREIQ